jgi:hypothetical protein
MNKTRVRVKRKESEEQTAIIEWANIMQHRVPELALLYHVPNGGSRNVVEAKRLKAQGVKPGVPDLVLPVARGKYHGLYIELKTLRGRVSDAQKQWIDALRNQGYAAIVCRGADEAIAMIAKYLAGEEVQ